ncbi:MAG: 16S rRNA (adenine(1518)-N(6)/adenine(1519)-N(6))-dimethyltransferase [Gammaproteobacteria bacterium]|nr:16S rRNA (adenine(1518)-N(6)/adenine(1519)-N(6))-dimethyltransferase [Gammaproteobacteria bacterium]
MIHQARKRFGQNFLLDTNIIQKIVDCIAPSSKDHLVEIGPGQGALTKPLAQSGARLDCIEIDRDLAEFLKKQFVEQASVNVFQHDILKFDLNNLAPKKKSLRVIGNLPYNISTPVIFHLLKNHHLIYDMIFMLQLEVVQRLIASPGNKAYGRLRLMVQYFCDIEHVFNIPSSAFIPKPNVVSAIVRLKPHDSFPITAKNPEFLETVIRTAFNQRRKTIRNSLRNIIPEAKLQSLPIDISLRPEKLSLADYVLLSDQISK